MNGNIHFDCRISPSEENSAQSSPALSQRQSHENENTPPINASFLQQIGNEMNSTKAGKAMSTVAKITSNKMSELLCT